MTTGATGQLGLALPVQGELSGTWGDTVNNGITQYTNIAIAATLTLTNDGAVTLANTTGDASASNITSTLTGAGTVTAQFAIVRITGTLTVAKVVTAPSYSKTYTVVNAATGGIVTFKAAGQTGVSIAVGESAFVYFNGTDYVKVSSTVATGVTSFTAGTTGFTPNTSTTGAVTLAGTLATANGGTNLGGATPFTSGGVVYASSSSALATGSALTFDGSNTLALGPGGSAVFNMGNTTSYGVVNGTGTNPGAIYFNGATRTSYGSFLQYGAVNHVFYNETLGSELMRILNTGNVGIGTSSPTAKLHIAVPDASVDGTKGVRITNPVGTVVILECGGSGDSFVGTTSTSGFSIRTSNTVRATFDTSGNVLVGGTAARGTTAGAAHLDLFNGTAPAGTLTNGISLYSDSGDFKFMDAAGSAYSVGYRNVPQSGAAKSSSYTLATTDVGEYLNVVSGGSIVIPNATFANGDVITIFNNHTATMTITCSITFAYIAGNSTDKATMTLAAAGLATILFISSTECVVSGNVT